MCVYTCAVFKLRPCMDVSAFMSEHSDLPYISDVSRDCCQGFSQSRYCYYHHCMQVHSKVANITVSMVAAISQWVAGDPVPPYWQCAAGVGNCYGDTDCTGFNCNPTCPDGIIPNATAGHLPVGVQGFAILVASLVIFLCCALKVRHAGV